MSRDVVAGGGQDGNYRTAAGCIQAGMYWWGQSDFAAAEAWWRRALELEPANARAHECLRLLQRTSSTGFKSDSWARLPASSPGPRPAPAPAPDVFSDPDRPQAPPEPARSPMLPAHDLVSSWLPEGPTGPISTSNVSLDLPEDDEDDLDLDSGRYDSAPESGRAVAANESAWLDSGRFEGSGATALGEFIDAATRAELGMSEGPTHDIEERADGDGLAMPPRPVLYPRSEAGAGATQPPSPTSPWDEGPSRTSVITLKGSGEFDAVADPTPLPEVDRGRFFNRGDPSSREEIEEFLRATGDLPHQRGGSSSADARPGPAPGTPSRFPTSDAGLELPEVDAGMVLASEPAIAALDRYDALQDAVLTEPSTKVELASPRAALQAARDRYQLHDFRGVIEALDSYPQEGEGQTEVRNMMAESRANLLRMYEAKIGGLDQIPRVLVSNEEIIWLNLNHRAGFILSQVDGTVSYEDLISLSGMPRLDTVQILTELLDQNVIGS